MARTILLAIATTVALAAGCGGSELSESSRVASQAAAVGETGGDFVEGTNVAKEADPGQVAEIVFTVDESGFSGPGSTPVGWTRIVLENNGRQDHHLGLIKLAGDRTVDDLRGFIEDSPLDPLPTWALQSGGPADVSPGLSASVTQDLKQGEYAVVGYALDDDQVSRPALEMLRSLTVTASGTPGTQPTADVILTITDYAYNIRNTRDLFGMSAGKSIDSGPRSVRVTNEGKNVHEARMAEIENGKQAKDFPDLYVWSRAPTGATYYTTPMMPFPVIKDDGSGPAGPPPSKAIGGIMPIQPGETAYITVQLEPAWHFIYSLLEDREFGGSYLMRPMLLEYPVQ